MNILKFIEYLLFIIIYLFIYFLRIRKKFLIENPSKKIFLFEKDIQKLLILGIGDLFYTPTCQNDNEIVDLSIAINWKLTSVEIFMNQV